MNILTELKDRFQAALQPLVAEHPFDLDQLLSMIKPSQNAQFGDYQANLAMPLGKKLGKPPQEVAQEIIAKLDVADLCHTPEVAGPGFINLKLRDDWLTKQLVAARSDQRLGCAKTDSPKTYVVDFSSPNVAKPLHVGHIRSTVIGDALSRILRFAGHKVISDNHLGDWGTQFGMIMYGYQHFVDPVAYKEDSIKELGRLYKLVRQLMDFHAGTASIPAKEEAVKQLEQKYTQLESAAEEADAKAEKKRKKTIKKAKSELDEARKSLKKLKEGLEATKEDSVAGPLLSAHPDINKAVLDETAKLHEGSPLHKSLWEEFMPKCRESIHSMYKRMDINFDHELGESFYHDQLAGVVDSLKSKDMATESDGAMCVFLDGFEAPFLIQKKDGAFLYATTDLATIQYRMENWKPDAILYVVDFRQSEHFDKLFATAEKWGYKDVELRHIKFGTVTDEHGKPYKTRSGDTIGLEGLLDDAEEKAYEVVAANDDGKDGGWELDEPTRRKIAKVVGIAGLKYADLSHNRESDYVFSYEKMLAKTGDTATYMQYSYARVYGIFAKVGVTQQQIQESTAELKLDHPAERALGLRLLQFGGAIDDVLVDYRPNQLTAYLFDLAKSFSSFFDQCSVVKADTDEQRQSRLILCDLSARTIKQGLALLGIDVVEKM
ncbi:MAG: arginine--tRNA ligase [Planctomycetota bacterium]